jgi:hypothetical protein
VFEYPSGNFVIHSYNPSTVVTSGTLIPDFLAYANKFCIALLLSNSGFSSLTVATVLLNTSDN